MEQYAKFEDDLLAELLALNMAVTQLLRAVANTYDDPRLLLEHQLEAGEQAMRSTHLWSIPDDRRESVYENAIARYREIILSGQINE
jgi:hypothetical protein